MKHWKLKTLLLLSTLLLSFTLAKKKSKNIGAIWYIGDSITQSNADGDPNGSPRKSLYTLLKQEGYDFSYTGHHNRNVDGLPTTGEEVENNLYHYHSGVSGILIGDTAKGARFGGICPSLPSIWNKGRLKSVKPNAILIMLGTNDIGHKYKIEEAPKRIETLLNRIYNLPNIGEPTIFLSNVPPNRRNETDQKNVLAFNTCFPKIVKKYQAMGKKIHFVDVHTPIAENYKENMRGDNLHPNAAGNEVMAQQWFAAIKKRLKKIK